MMGRKILFLGDCNTLGVGIEKGNSYPDLVSASIGYDGFNTGMAMLTTREGKRVFQDRYGEDISIVTVQFGLVDSWVTVAKAPYVLYYPDGKLRKIGRKFAKKYKKIAKRLSLGRFFGEACVVEIDEYISNIKEIIEATKGVVLLIETSPNKDLPRNVKIEEYNAALKVLSDQYSNVYIVETYHDLKAMLDDYVHEDGTHLNEAGHALVASKVVHVLSAVPGIESSFTYQ